MTPAEIKALAKSAAEKTDQKLAEQISMLTRFSGKEVSAWIEESEINKEDLVEVMKILSTATKDNEKAAANILKIKNGVRVLVAMASKFL